MINAETAAKAKHGPQGFAKRRVTGGTQTMRDERLHAPILSLAIKRVRGCANGHLPGKHFLPAPGISPAGINANGQILHDRQGVSRFSELLVQKPLKPFMETDLVVMLLDKTSHDGRINLLKRMRPAGPAGFE